MICIICITHSFLKLLSMVAIGSAEAEEIPCYWSAELEYEEFLTLEATESYGYKTDLIEFNSSSNNWDEGYILPLLLPRDKRINPCTTHYRTKE